MVEPPSIKGICMKDVIPAGPVKAKMRCNGAARIENKPKIMRIMRATLSMLVGGLSGIQGDQAGSADLALLRNQTSNPTAIILTAALTGSNAGCSDPLGLR